jgi:hypothetical protein
MSKKKKVINFIGGKHCSIILYSVGGKQREGQEIFERKEGERIRDL